MSQSRRSWAKRKSMVNAKIDVVIGTSSIAMGGGHFDGVSLKEIGSNIQVAQGHRGVRGM